MTADEIQQSFSADFIRRHPLDCTNCTKNVVLCLGQMGADRHQMPPVPCGLPWPPELHANFIRGRMLGDSTAKSTDTTKYGQPSARNARPSLSGSILPGYCWGLPFSSSAHDCNLPSERFFTKKYTTEFSTKITSACTVAHRLYACQGQTLQVCLSRRDTPK